MYGSLVLCSMDLFYAFNGCCLLLWLNILFNISRNSFYDVGINISHLKHKGSNCMIYLLLMYLALFLTWLISSLCNVLVLTGSGKLKSLTQLLIAILFCLHCISISFSGIMCWCDIVLGSAGALCVRLLEFSITFNFLKLFDYLTYYMHYLLS